MLCVWRYGVLLSSAAHPLQVVLVHFDRKSFQLDVVATSPTSGNGDCAFCCLVANLSLKFSSHTHDLSSHGSFSTGSHHELFLEVLVQIRSQLDQFRPPPIGDEDELGKLDSEVGGSKFVLQCAESVGCPACLIRQLEATAPVRQQLQQLLSHLPLQQQHSYPVAELVGARSAVVCEHTGEERGWWHWLLG